MNPARDDAEVRWLPGWEWLAAVVLLHLLAVLPWLKFLGPWPLVPCALSLAYHGRVYARREVWRFALVEESVVLFEPKRPGVPARPTPLRGRVWMTERWLLVRTRRRVLALRSGRYDAVLFARLRRALRAAEAAEIG